MRFRLEDENREYRPSTTTLSQIDVVHCMIERNRRVNYSEIREAPGICMTTIQTIIHMHPSVKKVRLTDDQKTTVGTNNCFFLELC